MNQNKSDWKEPIFKRCYCILFSSSYDNLADVVIFFNQSLVYFYTLVHHFKQIWSNIVSPFKFVPYKKGLVNLTSYLQVNSKLLFTSHNTCTLTLQKIHQNKGDVCKKINIIALMVALLPYVVWFWTTAQWLSLLVSTTDIFL